MHTNVVPDVTPPGAPPPPDVPERPAPQGQIPRGKGAAAVAGAPKPKAKRPRQGGGGGGGGGSSDPTLSKWKANVGAAVDAVKPGDTSKADAAGDAVKAKGDEQDAKRKGEAKDLLQDAKSALKPGPQPEEPEAFNTKPAREAIKSVLNVAEFTLPNQTLRKWAPPPAEVTALAEGAPAPKVTDPKQLAHDPPPASDKAVLAEQHPVRKDTEADLKAKKMAEAVGPTATRADAGDITLQDKKPASLEPFDAKKGEAIGDVLAMMLAQVDTHASRITDGAKRSLVRGREVAPLTALAKADQKGLTSEIGTELHGIGESAGVSSEALDAKTSAITKEMSDKGAAASEKVAAAGDENKAKVEDRGKKELGDIKGGAEANEAEIEDKKVAAQGGPDEAQVNAKRDEFLGKIESIASAHTARLRTVAEKRSQDIDAAVREQQATVRAAGVSMRDAIRRKIEAGTGAEAEKHTKAQVESRKATDWADDQSTKMANDAELAKLAAKDAADAATKRLQEAREQAREQVRQWAADAMGKTRSWWDRFMDMVSDWLHSAEADNKAWEQQRNAESRDAMAADFELLTRIREGVDKDAKGEIEAALKGLDADQRALVMEYMKGGGKNGIGFVAMMAIGRLTSRRVPELASKWEDTVSGWTSWQDQQAVAQGKNPGFNAQVIGNDVRASVVITGTDEKKLFGALSKARTKVERAAVNTYYQETFGCSMESDVKGDTGGDEQERAVALMAGDTDTADAAALEEAMGYTSTDEDAIYDVLRGKTPVEVERLKRAYKAKFGKDLDEEFAGGRGLDPREQDIANALMKGDNDAATAAEVQDAMEGAGTNEGAITKAYERIRTEEEARGARKGMSTAEIEAAIARRTADVRQKFNTAYGDMHKDDEGEGDALDRALQDEMSGAELQLGKALAAKGDQTEIDAAKARVEHESAYTSDKTVEELLRHQRERASKEVDQDLRADQQYLKDQAAAGDVTQEDYDAKKKGLQERKDKKKEEVDKRSKDYVNALRDAYDDKKYEQVVYDESGNPVVGAGSKGDFDRMLDQETSGYDHDKIKKLADNGAELSDDDEIFYAVAGAGTDEERLKSTLKGRPYYRTSGNKGDEPLPISELKEKYEAHHKVTITDEALVAAAQQECIASPDFTEAMTARLEGRQPRFGGRTR